jgi:quercetin dioxygenase-like cupin family protein
VHRWHLTSIEASGKRDPKVLFSTPECRAVLIDLPAGEQMGEHSVHERAVVQILSGAVEVRGGASADTCGAGTLIQFDPNERHALRAVEASRVLLLLAPWPGDGHYAEGETRDPQRLPRNAAPPAGAS